MTSEVLIVGAGPTGLALALFLSHLGVTPRIIDRALEPGTHSRALAVHARTLEFYRMTGLHQACLAEGLEFAAINLHVRGRKVARAVFGDIGKGLSPFPFILILPQDVHERILIEALAKRGITVERGITFVGLDQTSSGVAAQLSNADGSVEIVEARFLCGADGASSAVRHALNIGFPGGSYSDLFYVADVTAQGEAGDGELHVSLDRDRFAAMFPMRGPGAGRLVGLVPHAAERRLEVDFEAVRGEVEAALSTRIAEVRWFSTYHVHHRVADQFRVGAAFLLGDAGHIHSPAGGQGMNTGIGDAVNLAWKLAGVLRGTSRPEVLDSYEPERIAFARRLVASTDRGFTLAVSPTRLARFVRLSLLPRVMPSLARLPAVRRLQFRTVSQIAIEYRASPLSEGKAGQVQAGDRLPFVSNGPGGADNFAPLSSLAWQVHVYGRASEPLLALCREHGMACHAIAWGAAAERAGVARDALYVVRPDGHVGLAMPQQDVEALQRYLNKWGIRSGDDEALGSDMRHWSGRR